MFIDRRTFVKGAAVTGAAAVAPQVLVRTARGQDKNQVLFVSEESNPKATRSTRTSRRRPGSRW
jgi:hypothetical protein